MKCGSHFVYHQCLHDTFVACFCLNRERKSPTINKLVLRALFFLLIIVQKNPKIPPYIQGVDPGFFLGEGRLLRNDFNLVSFFFCKILLASFPDIHEDAAPELCHFLEQLYKTRVLTPSSNSVTWNWHDLLEIPAS